MTIQLHSGFLRSPTKTKSGLALFEEITCGLHHALLDIAVSGSLLNEAAGARVLIPVRLLRSRIPKTPSQAYYWRGLMLEMGQPPQALDGVLELVRILTYLSPDLDRHYAQSGLGWEQYPALAVRLQDAARVGLTALKSMSAISDRLQHRYFLDNEQLLLPPLLQVTQGGSPFGYRSGHLALPVMPRPRPPSSWTCQKSCIVEWKGKDLSCSLRSLSELSVLCLAPIVPDIGSSVVVEIAGQCLPGLVVWKGAGGFNVKFTNRLERGLITTILAG